MSEFWRFGHVRHAICGANDIPMESQIRYRTTGIDDKHAVLALAEDVGEVMGVDLVTPLEERARAVGHPGGITPLLSPDVWDFIREGKAEFSLNHLLDDEDHNLIGTGAGNVTSIAEQMDMSVREVVRALMDDGQIADAEAGMRFLRDDEIDPSAAWIVAYILLTYGVGWFAEQQVAAEDDMSAGGLANEMAGQDVRHEPTNEMLQVKPMTTYSKHGPEVFEAKEVQHIFYQFDASGGMGIATADRAADMNGKIADMDGIGATLARTKHSKYKHPEDGDRYRYLWW